VELFRPPVWMLENPLGRIQKKAGLPEPLLTFDPWHFGDSYSKRTQIFGKFDPELPTAMVEPTDGSKIVKLSSGAKYERSLTPEGFAYAFFMANNAEAMTPGKSLAQEFAGVEAELFQRAVDGGASEYDIRAAIEDAYYDNDLETVREALAEFPGPAAPAPSSLPDEAVLTGDYARLEGRVLEQPVLVAETGQTATIKVDAAKAMRTIDTRLRALEELRKCLTGGGQ